MCKVKSSHMLFTLRQCVHSLVDRLHATLKADADGTLVSACHARGDFTRSFSDTLQSYECIVAPDAEAVEMLYALETITRYLYSCKHCSTMLGIKWMKTINKIADELKQNVCGAIYHESDKPNGITARLLLNCGLLYHDINGLTAHVPEIKDILQMRELHYYAETLEYAAGKLHLAQIEPMCKDFAKALSGSGSAFDPNPLMCQPILQ